MDKFSQEGYEDVFYTDVRALEGLKKRRTYASQDVFRAEVGQFIRLNPDYRVDDPLIMQVMSIDAESGEIVLQVVNHD